MRFGGKGIVEATPISYSSGEFAVGQDFEIRITGKWDAPLDSGDIVGDEGGIFTLKKERVNVIKISHANVTGKTIHFRRTANRRNWSLADDTRWRREQQQDGGFLDLLDQPLSAETTTDAPELKEVSTALNDERLDFYNQSHRERLQKRVAANLPINKKRLKESFGVSDEEFAKWKDWTEADLITKFLDCKPNLTSEQLAVRTQLLRGGRLWDLLEKQSEIESNEDSIKTLQDEKTKLVDRYNAYDIDQSATPVGWVNREARRGIQEQVRDIETKIQELRLTNRTNRYAIDASLFPTTEPSPPPMDLPVPRHSFMTNAPSDKADTVITEDRSPSGQIPNRLRP